MPAPNLPELDAQLSRQKEREPFAGSLFCLDPGNTTGWAIFNGCILHGYGEWKTDSAAEIGGLLHAELESFIPYMVIYEDYRVYKWKKDQHAGSHLLVPRLIGVVEYICSYVGIPFVAQMAHQAKHFCTDSKLRDWDMYPKGQQHARDAIRHGIYYILFGRHSNA